MGEVREPYPADKARGGKIILRTSIRRTIFLAGQIGAVLLVVILSLFS
jgi:hypothetical protein